MINDLQSFYEIGKCPKCGHGVLNVRFQEAFSPTGNKLDEIPEHLEWMCAKCHYAQLSKTMDNSK